MKKKTKNKLFIGMAILLLIGIIWVFGISQTQRWVKNDYTTYSGNVGNDEITLKMTWHTSSYSNYWDFGDFNDSFTQSHDFKSSDGVFEKWRGILVDEKTVKDSERYSGWDDKPQWLVNLEGKRYPVQEINFDGYEMQQISGSCEVRSLQKKYQTNDFDYYHSEWYMYLTNCQMRGYIPLDSPVTFTSNGYVVVKIPKSGVECLDDSYCKSDFECLNNMCVEPILDSPTSPEPPQTDNILIRLANWIDNIILSLKEFFTSQTIIGPQDAQPGTTQTYQIDLSTNIPDTDFTDGDYQIQYANWVLVDEDRNIIEQGGWEEINGTYNKNVTLTLPEELNKYALIGIINQYDMKYDFTTKEWKQIKDEVVVKEAYNLRTSLPVPEKPSSPTFEKLKNIIDNFVDWIKGLF